MGRAIQGINWEEVQLSYQKGENCREIGERLGVSVKAISQRCTKEGWRKEAKIVGELVSKITIQSLAELRAKKILELEDATVPIAMKLQKGVEHSFDSMQGEAIDSAHLHGLANALKVANSVARLNLGAVDPSQRLDLTSGGLSLHESALSIIASCKKLKDAGQLPSSSEIDVDALLLEHEAEKAKE